MAVQLKNDVSYLFTSLNSNLNNSGLDSLYSVLTDYSSIKSGSYGKLMKAYYSLDASDEVTSLVKKDTTKQESDSQTKAVANAQTKADALDTAVGKLYTSKEDSVWAEGDMDEIYNAVSSYVTEYNATLKGAAEVEDSAVNNRALTLIDNTKMYEKDLAQIGITINKDDTLSIDKKTFLAAGADKVEEVFNGRGSYGHIQDAQVDLLKSAIDYKAVSSSTYNSSATYNMYGSSGNLFDSLF